MSAHPKPTGLRRRRDTGPENTPLTPGLGSPLATQSDPQDTVGSPVPRTPTVACTPTTSFTSEFTTSSPERQQRSDSTLDLDRSRSNSFSDKLGLNRLFERGKRKGKLKRSQRDKSIRPARADILDKEETSKLRKFWGSLFGDEEGSTFTSSPPTGTFGTALPPVDEGHDLPQIHVDDRALGLQSQATHTIGGSRIIRRKPVMDSSRLAPGSADGEKKQKAIQDARDMHNAVLRSCERTNRAVPPYEFIELIGKGASGRVYKCRDKKSGNLVAVKIINTDDTDYATNTLDKDDTIKDFRKEVDILLQLKDSKAKNINMILDAFALQEQLWIVCEYCTGGSVRTLMRANPASSPGLEEQYIIPIARELALAIKSVHDIGVIHRDIKCTNVYITEDGDIQLGDYGIVGVLDDEGSKRRTIIGTPHYMPREMLGPGGSTNQAAQAYGTEIDIWAFGCSVYEMATGLPPNAYKPPTALDRVLINAPRLEGGQYSQELRDFIAFCLNSDPQERPKADAVLKHPYIAGTQKKHPTKGLVNLIHRYKVWEYGGGWRQSLFMAGGAPPVVGSEENPERENEGFEDWKFSTSDSFNQDFEKRYSHMVTPQDTPSLRLETAGGNGLAPIRTENLTPFERVHQEMSASRGEQSLQRLWNPDAAPYELHTPLDDESRLGDHLPLRPMNEGTSTRESQIIIDLDEIDVGGGDPTFNFDFGDVPTMKARHSRLPHDEEEEEDNFDYGQPDEDRDKRATMEWKFPTAKRATMDWKFPTREPKEPEDPEARMTLPPVGEAGKLPPAFRPTLKHTATAPVGQFRELIHPQPGGPASASPVRDSMHSMIDLDMAFDDPADIPRPSTASSATGSTMTDMTSGNPFDLEEDPEQNEIDRNRFSYHKQWQSEGGQTKRGSSRRSVPMHARGSSLSSTEDDFNHSSGTEEDVFNYEYNQRLSNTLGHQLNGNLGHHDTVDMGTWPNFPPAIGYDEPQLYHDDLNGNTRRPGQIPRTNGQHSSLARSRPTSTNSVIVGGQDEIEFPQITAPNPQALYEHADPRLVVSELERLMDELGESLRVTATALQAHTDVYVDEDTGGESESGMGTADEDSY
ncbi:hypothetical protein LTR37_012838 [Vermiconidia calcicola]|uniref:Uncharacterized protein n=1 Tax=Vermiconidia calcicola TaxID=1690605 RepID=A0ACC3MYD3_9PEZI|nr:hypothetical protein LTR37_012838 [Vermiconidia calcicola]